MQKFICDVPAIGIVSESHLVTSESPYDVDRDVQLVCKYLRALEQSKNKKKQGINKLYVEGMWINVITPQKGYVQ